MFRVCLPAALCLACATSADELRLPELTDEPPETELPACENIPGSGQNCARVLACVGNEGVYFEGQARGWDAGTVTGRMNDGTTCSGHWDSRGPFNTGRSGLACSDGTTVTVLYYSQDPETGTVIGSGRTSDGRGVQVWTGENVLKYLTEDGEISPRLPCGGGDILIS